MRPSSIRTSALYVRSAVTIVPFLMIFMRRSSLVQRPATALGDSRGRDLDALHYERVRRHAAMRRELQGQAFRADKALDEGDRLLVVGDADNRALPLTGIPDFLNRRLQVEGYGDRNVALHRHLETQADVGPPTVPAGNKELHKTAVQPVGHDILQGRDRSEKILRVHPRFLDLLPGPRLLLRRRHGNEARHGGHGDADGGHGAFHGTISAVSNTAWSSTSAPAAAHSLEMFSASLCESPSTQGHMIMVAGATRAIQQASCPAPEMMFMWL